MEETQIRHCLECGKVIYGRMDKKFCNDTCRTAHSNKIYKSTRKEIQRIYKILLRNHHILDTILQHGLSRPTIQELYIKGFKFDYFTSIRSKDGRHLELCCFDINYTICEGSVYIWR